MLIALAILVGIFFLFLSIYILRIQKQKISILYQYKALQKSEEAQRQHLEQKMQEIQKLQETITELKVQNSKIETTLIEERKLAQEKLRLLTETQEKLSKTFQLLSSEALEKNTQHFFEMAKNNFEQLLEKTNVNYDKKHQALKEFINPVKETLHQLNEGIVNIEKERKGEQESLRNQMQMMIHAEKELRQETASLVRALKAPTVRGRWGEMQLRRVVEIAGMVNHCDFYEQAHEATEDGAFRPDLIVRLPAKKQVLVDAKTPFDAYFEAMQSENEHEKKRKLKDHARSLRQHIVSLGKKSYWEHFQPTPEFVVLFIPSETFLSAALEIDPTLIEIGVEYGVIIATPTTLIGLLRAVAYGWKQENLSQHVKEISQIGYELYKRIADMRDHWHRVGKALTQGVEAYNKAIGSLESRVLVSARKFKDLGASNRVEIHTLKAVEKIPRNLQAKEMEQEEKEMPTKTLDD